MSQTEMQSIRFSEREFERSENSYRTGRQFIKNEIQTTSMCKRRRQTVKRKEQPSVVLDWTQTFQHESLILAQDERWRRA